MNKLVAKAIASFFKKEKRSHIRQMLYHFSILKFVQSVYYVLKILICCPRDRGIVIEANPFHTECLYSVLSYLKAEKEIIVFGDKEALSLGILDRCVDFPKPKSFFITPVSLWMLDKLHFLNHCRFVFANSYLIWWAQTSVESFLNNYLKTGKNLLVIDHAPGKWTPVSSSRPNVHQFVLADFLSKIYPHPPLYACVFPQEKQKQKKFLFLSVGVACDPKRRDMDSFLVWLKEHSDCQSCIITRDLSDKRIHEKIISLPNNTLLFSPPFSVMFDYISQSVFMPFLIHGDNLGYYQTSISGNMNLALGLGIIPIIDKRLARLYGFTEKEAIIYNGQSELFNALNQATLLSEQQIKQMRRALLVLRKKCIQKSFSNISSFLYS